MAKPVASKTSSPGFGGTIARSAGRGRLQRAEDTRVFPRFGNPDRERLWVHGSVHGDHGQRHETVPSRYLGQARGGGATTHPLWGRGPRGARRRWQQNRFVNISVPSGTYSGAA